MTEFPLPECLPNQGSLYVNTYVYGLFDPIDGEIRYIGCTINPVQRLAGHRSACQGLPAFREWIKGIKAAGRVVHMKLLDMVVGQSAGHDREMEIIGEHRIAGARLFNRTNKYAGCFS